MAKGRRTPKRGDPKTGEGHQRSGGKVGAVKVDPCQQNQSHEWAPGGALGQEMVVVRGQEGMVSQFLEAEHDKVF